VTYRVDSEWGMGFVATVTVTNTGDTPVDRWTMRWAFPGSQQVGQGWGAHVSQDGEVVSAENAAWNATVAPGGSVSFGFMASHDGDNPAPTAYSFNGGDCD
jgi:cellulase/cellobiase CelA1